MNDWLKARYEDAKLAYAALMKFYPFTLEDLDGEQWADIAGYEGLYQVSTFGRVKSFKRYRQGKILKPHFGRSCYLQFELWKNADAKTIATHRLVAQTFIANPNNLPEVDHVYGMKFDNSVDNLRWATCADNARFAVELGLMKSGEESYQAKLTNEQVIYIRDNPDGLTQMQLAEKSGVNQASISAIQLGTKYKAAGGQIRSLKVRRIPNDIRKQIRDEYVRGSAEFGSYGLARKYGINKQSVLRIVNSK